MLFLFQRVSVAVVSSRLLFTCLIFAVPLSANAQTLPSGIINAPPTVIGEDVWIGSDTTLNVADGGDVGRGFEAGRPDGSSTNVLVNIDGGNFGGFSANAGSTVNIRGGNVGGIGANSGSLLNMSGGTVGQLFAQSGSVVNVSGGDLAFGFRGLDGSSAKFSGGTSGQFFGTFPGSSLELVGGEFRLNGLPISTSSISLEFGGSDLFTGTFADGSPFIFSGLSRDRIVAATLTETVLPAIDLTPMFVDAQNSTSPNGIRAGQTLTLRAGGALRNNFTAVDATLAIEEGIAGSGLKVAGTPVEVSGGSIGDDFTVHGNSVNITGGNVGRDFLVIGGEVNIDGGVVGDEFRAIAGSEVNVTSGIVGDNFQVSDGSTVNVSGGRIGNRFECYPDTTINLSGGEIGDEGGFPANILGQLNIADGVINFVRVENDGEVNMTGGTMGGGVFDSGGTLNLSGGRVLHPFIATDSSTIVNIRGFDFMLDGMPLNLEPNSSLEIAVRDVPLSGRLADGTAFEFDLISVPRRQAGRDIFSANATLTVVAVPALVEPLLGDVDLNGVVNFGDISPFIAILSQGQYQAEADCDENGTVDFSDIPSFIAILIGS